MIPLIRVGEGVVMALDAMRANKLRSALTVLGVIIGVATVMTMASIVQGVRTQIFNALETAGPTAFYVMRYFSQTPVNPDNLPYEVRIRPVLKESDAAAIAAIPEILYSGMWIQIFARIESQRTSTQTLIVWAADDHYMDIQGGTLLRGRFFTRSELTGEQVIVLEEETADFLFGRTDPLGQLVRVNGVPFRVIGLYQKPQNIFEPPGQQNGAIVPYRAGKYNLRYDETNGLFIPEVVLPGPESTTSGTTRPTASSSRSRVGPRWTWSGPRTSSPWRCGGNANSAPACPTPSTS